jgi:hypothetical protein
MYEPCDTEEPASAKVDYDVGHDTGHFTRFDPIKYFRQQEVMLWESRIDKELEKMCALDNITNHNPLPNPNSRLPITMEGHVHLIGEFKILCF